MNKFEQEALKRWPDESERKGEPAGFRRRVNKMWRNRFLEGVEFASSTHDKEMIEFAEWVSAEGWVYSTIAKAWVNRYDDDISSTSAELLTIFRNQQK